MWLSCLSGGLLLLGWSGAPALRKFDLEVLFQEVLLLYFAGGGSLSLFTPGQCLF